MSERQQDDLGQPTHDVLHKINNSPEVVRGITEETVEVVESIGGILVSQYVTQERYEHLGYHTLLVHGLQASDKVTNVISDRIDKTLIARGLNVEETAVNPQCVTEADIVDFHNNLPQDSQTVGHAVTKVFRMLANHLRFENEDELVYYGKENIIFGIRYQSFLDLCQEINHGELKVKGIAEWGQDFLQEFYNQITD
ncbi:MAG: hypothetical protein U5K77_03355 [Candidatus Saccharibacteria bacterium]|nr:hypothetical protein [Candidatus Saccharibacteria bacterium]